MYYISEVGGSKNALEADPPNREIDFDFDFDSIVRAGEAKLRERVMGVPSQRWVCEREEMRLLLLLLLLVRLVAQFKQYLVRVLSFYRLPVGQNEHLSLIHI